LLPHILPHVNMTTPTMFPVDKKTRAHKKVGHKNVLIPWYPISYLTIASSGFFWERLRVPTRRCDLVVPVDWGWGRSNKTIPAICNTPRQTQCVRNSIFPHFIMVIMCCVVGPVVVCGLWLCVGVLNRGCPKNFQKTTST